MQQEYFQTSKEMKNKNMEAETKNPNSQTKKRICGFRRPL